VRTTVRALSDCLAIHGDTGLMARCVAPEASHMGRTIVATSDPARVVRRTLRGEAWVGTSGNSGASRDVYIECVYGLMACHDLVTDPAVRADCARIVTSMVRYLVANDFIVDEDRDPFDGATAPTFPTFWLGVASQKVTFLLVAARLDAGGFASELARWGPLTEMAWLAEWSATFDLTDYYGFVLAHATYYTYFRNETDATRWAAMSRAYRIMRRYVANHKNAYFDALHLGIQPADLAYRGAVRESLARYVTRPHRKVAPTTLDLSGITWTTITLPLSQGSGTQLAQQGQQLTIPSEPLDPALRAPEDDLLWQRNPFTPYPGAGAGDARIETTGLDLVAPFWLGRYHGVPF
jgi:hypothetical protein